MGQYFNRLNRLLMDPSAVAAGAKFDPVNDVVKCALMQTTFAPNIDTHEQFDDIAASEIGFSAGYAVRGLALGTRSVTQNNTNDRGEFDAPDLVFTGINGPNAFNQYVLLREPASGATNANSDLMFWQSVPTTTPNGGNITLQWDPTGLWHNRTL